MVKNRNLEASESGMEIFKVIKQLFHYSPAIIQNCFLPHVVLRLGKGTVPGEHLGVRVAGRAVVLVQRKLHSVGVAPTCRAARGGTRRANHARADKQVVLAVRPGRVQPLEPVLVAVAVGARAALPAEDPAEPVLVRAGVFVRLVH